MAWVAMLGEWARRGRPRRALQAAILLSLDVMPFSLGCRRATTAGKGTYGGPWHGEVEEDELDAGRPRKTSWTRSRPAMAASEGEGRRRKRMVEAVVRWFDQMREKGDLEEPCVRAYVRCVLKREKRIS